MEYNTTGFLFVQSQHLTQMPGNCFSFTVFIGCQPDFLRILCTRFQFLYQFLLFGRYFVFWFESICVNTHFPFLQVTNMPIARHDLKILAEKFLYRLCLRRRLYYYQILLHTLIYLVSGCKSREKFWLHLIYIVDFLFS